MQQRIEEAVNSITSMI